MSAVRSLWRRVKRFTPVRFQSWMRRQNAQLVERRYAKLSLAEAFSQTYRTAAWGDGEDFVSGPGSRGPFAERYAEFIRDLVASEGIDSVVDVGCGDFAVASRFAGSLRRYTGVDIVPELVERNTRLHGTERINFVHADATRVRPPEAGACLVRQVLQHLSNEEIEKVLRNCAQYPIVIVTEDLPSVLPANAAPNRDKPHGPTTRRNSGSWVDIAQRPFSRSPVREVMRVRDVNGSSALVTWIWRPAKSAALVSDDSDALLR